MVKRTTKTLSILTIAMVVMTILQSCSNDPLSPGVEYMPDMYRSPAVEEYVDYAELWDRNRDSLRLARPAMMPPKGAIAYDAEIPLAQFNFPYPYPNTPEGYEQAGRELVNPLEFTEARYLKAKETYGIFCKHCHGEQGKGQGILVTRGKYPAPPAYQGIEGLTHGRMFHTLQYGKGNMGSHAGQLTREQRWELVHYVTTLREEKYDITFKNGLPVMENDADGDAPNSPEQGSASPVSAEGGDTMTADNTK